MWSYDLNYHEIKRQSGCKSTTNLTSNTPSKFKLKLNMKWKFTWGCIWSKKNNFKMKKITFTCICWEGKVTCPLHWNDCHGFIQVPNLIILGFLETQLG